MSKAKELTKSQTDQLCRVYDYLISLIEREQTLSINDENNKIDGDEIAQDENEKSASEQKDD